jgi:hypothetical protein
MGSWQEMTLVGRGTTEVELIEGAMFENSHSLEFGH